MAAKKLFDVVKETIVDSPRMKFHGIRFDIPDRKMRHYNQLGYEKNPNKVRFFALNEKEADGYNGVWDRVGDFDWLIPPGDPRVKRTDLDIEGNFLDLKNNYSKTRAYEDWRNEMRGIINSNYDRDASWASKLNSKSRREKELKRIERLREKELKNLEQDDGYNAPRYTMNFTRGSVLSDGERQNILAKELKEGNYDGYYWGDDEIAVFPWAKNYDFVEGK